MNSLLVKARDKPTLYAPILYWSGVRHWADVLGSVHVEGGPWLVFVMETAWTEFIVNMLDSTFLIGENL
jgi:hypothetical protein